jgi:hypothetical protein
MLVVCANAKPARNCCRPDPKRGYLCIAVAHFRDLDRHLRNQNDPASRAIEIRRTSVWINDYSSDSRAPASPWGGWMASAERSRLTPPIQPRDRIGCSWPLLLDLKEPEMGPFVYVHEGG